MIGSLVALVVCSGQGVSSPGRFEMGERLKELDQAWMATPDKARRSAAVPKINTAVAAFFGGKFGNACRALDEARAAVEGRSASSEDAVTLRFEPPFVEPRTSAKLRISWAYLPTIPKNVVVKVGRQAIVAAPGRSLVVDVRPEQVNPDILQNPEVGVLIPVQVGARSEGVFLSIIKRPLDRLAALKDTRSPEAKTLVEFLSTAFGSPQNLESDLPLIQYLLTAELLDEGRLKVERAESLPLAKFNDTYFRAAFPRSRGPMNIVIALHGAGGSENMFFEAYGRGMAATEALRRGWGFIAPRSSVTAIQDVLEWLRVRKKQSIGKVYLIGHSMGGGVILQSGSFVPKPSGIALFAPAATSIPQNLADVPIWLSVGKQDFLASGVRAIAQAQSGRKAFEFQELDPCEHMMVVADSILSAYRFFETTSGR